MVFVASGWGQLLVMEVQQVGTPDLPPHQLPDPSLEGGFSEFYRECSVPWGRGVLPEALGQALRGGSRGHTGRVSGSRSMKLGVLRLQRGEGVLSRESRGMDQAGPSVCPVTRAERSRRACRVGLRAQLCPVLPDLALLQARSGVGGTGVESAWRGPARVTSKQEGREVEGVPSALPLTATWSSICMGTLQQEGWPDHPTALLTAGSQATEVPEGIKLQSLPCRLFPPFVFLVPRAKKPVGKRERPLEKPDCVSTTQKGKPPALKEVLGRHIALAGARYDPSLGEVNVCRGPSCSLSTPHPSPVQRPPPGFRCEFLSVWTPMVVQWLRIHLPMQGTQVRALAQEDPTCRGATKPMRHNY
ncbi:hypothetical protein J1605_012163 [Eschrichtius robustus]|uniref:Uncharacterized protein n=1 Tax=Eschrichtius robustus TaxID=9764 RepID=A0AB34GLE9_ESCRO|nr:hypothetical protein J1605_012163 [Eschrichtius robustus]